METVHIRKSDGCKAVRYKHCRLLVISVNDDGEKGFIAMNKEQINDTETT